MSMYGTHEPTFISSMWYSMSASMMLVMGYYELQVHHH